MKNTIDYVVVNNWYISEQMADKYESLEKKRPVKVKNDTIFKTKNYKILQRDILHENNFVRHSFDKIAAVIEELIKKEQI